MKIVHNNDIEQITLLDERFYLDPETNEYFPSVNTVLDVYPKGYGYIQWLKDLGSNSEEVVRRAADQGSRIHEAIQFLINGQELAWLNEEKENYSLEEWLMILKFVDFYKTHNPKPLAVEKSLVSSKLGYGGTLDLVCELNGEIWLIDWKSGNTIYKTNKIQVSAYKQLWNESSSTKIQKVACMHLKSLTRGLDKSGKNIQGEGWKLEEVEDTDHLFKLFKHTQIIWKEENPNPKPKNMIYPDRISLKGGEKKNE